MRAAPIVCPEESRLCFLADYGPKGVQGGERKATLHCIAKRQLCRKRFPPVGTDAPTLACGHGLQPYGALDCFGWRSERVQGGT